MVRAYVLIQTEVGQTGRVAREVAEIEGTGSAVPVAGPYDVIAIVGREHRRPRQDRGLPHPRREGSHPYLDLSGRAHLRKRTADLDPVRAQTVCAVPESGESSRSSSTSSREALAHQDTSNALARGSH